MKVEEGGGVWHGEGDRKISSIEFILKRECIRVQKLG